VDNSCRKIANGTRDKEECERNADGPTVFGQITRGGGGGYGPPRGLAQCDTLRWGDMTNECIRACELNPGRSAPAWCIRHCDNLRRKNDRTPKWC
jgi:hypothetical protein